MSLTVALAATAAPSPESKSSKPGSPAADLTLRVYMPIIIKTEWTELARSPGGSYGSQERSARWRRVSWDAIGMPNAALVRIPPFEPTNPSDPAWGPLANWWTEGYDDSSRLEHAGLGPLDRTRQSLGAAAVEINLAIGHYAWSAAEDETSLKADLHRRVVTQTHKALRTRITIFSDNKSTWYINGHTVHSDTEGGFQTDISAEWHPCGDNLLAMQVSNDSDIKPVNPFGLQYQIEAVLDSPQPCGLTTTAPGRRGWGKKLSIRRLIGALSPERARRFPRVWIV